LSLVFMTTKMSRRTPARTGPGKLKRSLKRFIWVLLVAVFAFHILAALTLFYLRFMPPPITTVHVQRRVEALFSNMNYQKRYEFSPLPAISRHLQNAVVAAEDGRFFEHGGIDWMELQKVAGETRDRGEIRRGGSTITQQLIKNLFFTTHRSFVRKAGEFTLAPLAELILSKERILELYLNVIEWGPGVYGAEAAARHHYNQSARQLSREQAARLAACLPAPRTRTPQRMNRYSDEILRRMSRQGW
jgi:monofunctional glycosyltransferase